MPGSSTSCIPVTPCRRPWWSATTAYLENISVTEARGAADLSSTSPVHLPQTGETPPDFRFLNQDGRPIHLAQFRGEPLLLTFIYSRCPLPDYCVRMSNNFVEIAKTLQSSNPAAFAKLQMLSITLDPEFDDPKVLRAYGKTYAGAVDPNLKHWSFATASPADIRKTAEYFGLSYETAERSGHPQPAHRAAGCRWQYLRALSRQPVEARRRGRPTSGVAEVAACSRQI